MQNPWNFIIPTFKVSVTKVQAFFDLKEINFETSRHILRTPLENDENKRWPKRKILEILLYQL